MKQTLITALDHAEEFAAYWIGRQFPRPEVALGEESQTPYCNWCGQNNDVLTHCTCGCRSLKWSRVIRLGMYEPPLSTCIIRGKYSRWHDVLELMGKRLGQRIRGCVPPNAVIVPMPMPFIRWWFRGINHSAVLAKYVARSSGLARRNLLLRKESPPQAGMSANQRTQLNMKNIRPRPFGKLHGKPVVLVDDVLTTGRTLEVAAKSLRSIGASTITVAVVAVTNLPETIKKVDYAPLTP